MPLCIISHVKYLSISCCPVTNSRVLDRSEFSFAPARKQISAIAKHSLGPTTPPSSQPHYSSYEFQCFFAKKNCHFFNQKTCKICQCSLIEIWKKNKIGKNILIEKNRKDPWLQLHMHKYTMTCVENRVVTWYHTITKWSLRIHDESSNSYSD